MKPGTKKIHKNYVVELPVKRYVSRYYREKGRAFTKHLDHAFRFKNKSQARQAMWFLKIDDEGVIREVEVKVSIKK